LTFFVTFTHFD